MNTETVNSIREKLMQEDMVFRELVSTHEKFENRLDELSSLHFPTEEEQFEEHILKKKKLAVKDEIYSIISNHAESNH